jgi:C4-dicarboxylate transporter DctM subunit
VTVFPVFICLILLLLSGIPIFAALGLTATGILLISEGNISGVADTVFAHLNRDLLTTIPLFVLMAQIMVRAKVIDDLYDFAHTVIGHIKGGLGVATVLSCTIFAAISGSSVATALSVGSSAIPQMARFGYPRQDALGVIAAGGTLGILIPPSGPMILYAIVSEVSIGALFLAGIIPGLLMALVFSVFCVIQASRRKNISSPKAASFEVMFAATKRSIWALLAPPVVLGGIYFGIFTASEAAAAGCLYALLVAIMIYRNFGLKDLWACTISTMRTSMMVFMIIAGAAMFGHAITLIRLPVGITQMVVGFGLGPIGFIIAVMVLIFILGMFLESIAIILITTPILLPTMLQLGINPVWYGILLMINLELAMITPPVGMNLFVIKGITEAPLSEVVRGASPFVILMLAGLAMLIAVPQIALWLPQSAGFGR